MVSKHVDDNSSIGNIIDIERFRSKGKLLRTVAYVMKFIRKLRNSIQGIKTYTGELSVEEIREAENIVT